MDVSIFLAKVFGLYMVIVGLVLVLRTNQFPGVVNDFFKNRAVMLLGAILALIVGIVIVVSHNLWVADWRIVITLIGWVALIKGVYNLFFPVTPTWFVNMIQQVAILRVVGVFDFLVGLFLVYQGFFR